MDILNGELSSDDGHIKLIARFPYIKQFSAETSNADIKVVLRIWEPNGKTENQAEAEQTRGEKYKCIAKQCVAFADEPQNHTIKGIKGTACESCRGGLIL